MHLDYVYEHDGEKPEDGFFYDTADQTFGPGGTYAGVKKPNEAKSQTSWELDKELQQIYAREFGMSREDVEDQERRKWMKKKTNESKPNVVKYDKKGSPIYPARGPQEEYLIVDGYNIIFAWKDLNELSRVNIDSARDKLLDILSNYQGYRKCTLILVLDAYKVEGHREEVTTSNCN